MFSKTIYITIFIHSLVETAQLKTCGTDILKVTQDKVFSITLQCYDSNGEPTNLGELIVVATSVT